MCYDRSGGYVVKCPFKIHPNPKEKYLIFTVEMILMNMYIYNQLSNLAAKS